MRLVHQPVAAGSRNGLIRLGGGERRNLRAMVSSVPWRSVRFYSLRVHSRGGLKALVTCTGTGARRPLPRCSNAVGRRVRFGDGSCWVVDYVGVMRDCEARKHIRPVTGL